MSRLTVVLIVVLSVGAVGVGAADPITVDGDGSADNSTIQAAVDAADSGDRIVVNDGTYYESVNVSQSDIVIEANGSATPVVVGNSTEKHSWSSAFYIQDEDNITIEGFEITEESTRSNTPAVVIGINIGARNSAVEDVDLKDLYIHALTGTNSKVAENTTYGILAWGPNQSHVDVMNTEIEYIGADDGTEPKGVGIHPGLNWTISGGSISNVEDGNTTLEANETDSGTSTSDGSKTVTRSDRKGTGVMAHPHSVGATGNLSVSNVDFGANSVDIYTAGLAADAEITDNDFADDGQENIGIVNNDSETLETKNNCWGGEPKHYNDSGDLVGSGDWAIGNISYSYDCGILGGGGGGSGSSGPTDPGLVIGAMFALVAMLYYNRKHS
jgi:hypothetical protein